MKVIAMIPARLGSQRLKRKNLEEINKKSLVEIAIDKCVEADCFDEIWVNSESELIGNIALKKNIFFHKRPSKLADNISTSEEFVLEFLQKHECDYIIQVHSIAPLLSSEEIKSFTLEFISSKANIYLSAIYESLECTFKTVPINFSLEEKTNSQLLEPIKKITWSITGWERERYLNSKKSKKCATYDGEIGIFEVSKWSGHVIKTQKDLDLARVLFDALEI
jgi:CMP-N-acetylneuraminic acid synthetase